MLLWHVSWGTTPCVHGLRSIASRRRSQGRTPDLLPLSHQSRSSNSISTRPSAPLQNTATIGEEIEQLISPPRPDGKKKRPPASRHHRGERSYGEEEAEEIYLMWHRPHRSGTTARKINPTYGNNPKEKWRLPPPPAAVKASRGGHKPQPPRHS